MGPTLCVHGVIKYHTTHSFETLTHNKMFVGTTVDGWMDGQGSTQSSTDSFNQHVLRLAATG